MILAVGAINFYFEGSFQVFRLDYHPYPSSKRREAPVLAFGAGATDNKKGRRTSPAEEVAAAFQTRTDFALLNGDQPLRLA